MDSLKDVSLTRSETCQLGNEQTDKETSEEIDLLPMNRNVSILHEDTVRRHTLSQRLSCGESVTSHCSHVLHSHYTRELLEAAMTLQSLCNVQDTSIGLIENRHRELIDIRETYQLEEVIEEAQSYYNKVLRLKKEMAALSAKSKELAKRAAHVKDVRAKEQAKRDEERKRVEQIEKDLAPRYASGLTN
ncbi:hypothetical protein BIW11_01594 [Tropilaelaps mercedesae]|uniref:Biogenesis of lysosome-related organelles complex 1 subunit 6 n=1 Tax=Tropilaelaps mercedesae TaxID=418985 RepID=A0A1V9XC19_9ACAR|nr:hypothetical protein BIW11_01594 [Tropilaelaps mercedesae]